MVSMISVQKNISPKLFLDWFTYSTNQPTLYIRRLKIKHQNTLAKITQYLCGIMEMQVCFCQCVFIVIDFC